MSKFVDLKSVNLSNGEILTYREEGMGEETLLLIHGNMSSSKHWDICANLSLKLGITKKLTLLDDIISQLNEVVINEQKVISNLGNLLK